MQYLFKGAVYTVIRVQVPATVANLGPGFDCLAMGLELYNVVEAVPAARGLSIEISGEGAGVIPRNDKNLVYVAISRLFSQLGLEVPGLRLRLANQIPVERGLGSSSAAIVGGAVAANILAGGRMSIRELINFCSSQEGHPDNVAAALLGGIVVCVLDNGEVKWLKITPPPHLKCVVAVPDFALSTRAARDVLPAHVPLADAVFNISRAAMLVASLQQGELGLLGVATEDRLHQIYRSPFVPGLKKVMAAARLAGARGVALCGAGPAVVAFADANLNLVARVMGETFRESGVKAKVMVLKPAAAGARALEVK